MRQLIMGNDLFEIRAIIPSDKAIIQMGLTRLSTESKRQRFFSSRKSFTEKELKFLTEVDQINHIAFMGIEHETKMPAGTIRCIRDSNRANFAELAVTIIDHFQGKGLGTQLLDALAQKALTQNITHFYGDFHTSNVKMHRVLEKYCAKHQIPPEGLKLTHKSDGYLYFEMALA